MRRMRNGMAIATAMALGACGAGTQATVHMRNPAGRTLSRDSSTVVLPNNPPDEASLIAFTQERVCFAVLLRGGREWSNLPNWETTLTVDDTIEMRPDTVERVEATTEQWNGERAVAVQDGTYNECVRRNQYGQCERVENRPTYRTHYEATVNNVDAVSWRVCFEHDGRQVTPSTRRLELRLAPQSARFGRGRSVDGRDDLGFIWEFY